MINLKDDIWIEGCDKNEPFDKINGGDNFFNLFHLLDKDKIIYLGKTSEIPRDLAKSLLKIDEKLSHWEDYDDVFYMSYDGDISHSDYRDSLKSTCDKEYCIIYKK